MTCMSFTDSSLKDLNSPLHMRTIEACKLIREEITEATYTWTCLAGVRVLT